MALVKMFQITHVQPLPTPFMGDRGTRDPQKKLLGTRKKSCLEEKFMYENAKNVRKCKDPENFFKNGSPVPSFPEITVLNGIVKNFRGGSVA